MNTTVYYPYINPPLRWLKVASLCWDKVYTLNTHAYGSPVLGDPECDRFSALVGGLVDRSIRVEDIVDEELVARFQKWVELHEQDLKQKGLSSARQPLFGMYDTKFERPIATEENLRKWLIDRGLARVEEPSDKSQYGYSEKWGWTEAGASSYVRDTMVFLPRDIALHYLSLCAAKAALSGNRDLIAGDAAFTDIILHDARSVRAQVATAVLEAYLPADFDDLALERLAGFRADFATLRLRYQSEIQSMVREFSDVASEGQLEVIKDRIIELAKERIEETTEAYRRAQLKTVVKVFGISLTPPAVATSIASALGIGLFAPAAIAAAVSLFGLELLIDRGEARSARTNSPWSYVLNAAELV